MSKPNWLDSAEEFNARAKQDGSSCYSRREASEEALPLRKHLQRGDNICPPCFGGKREERGKGRIVLARRMDCATEAQRRGTVSDVELVECCAEWSAC